MSKKILGPDPSMGCVYEPQGKAADSSSLTSSTSQTVMEWLIQWLLVHQTESLTHTREKEGKGQDRARGLPLNQKRPENISTDEGNAAKTLLCVSFGQETG